MTRFASGFLFLLLPGLCYAAETIPVTRGTSLSGDEYMLPRDLAAGRSILILGFSEKSATQSATWSKKLLGSLCLEQQSATCYELPVLAGVPKLFRGVVLHGIKKETPGSMLRSFLPVFEKEQEWKRVAQFRESDDAYLLLVNRVGEVEWKTHGDCTTERLQELKKAIDDPPKLPGRGMPRK